MNLLLVFLLVIDALVCLLLVLVVLMQRSKQDGIGAAFGSGVTDAVFGAQTSSVLVKFTGWLAALFFLLSIVLAHLYGSLAKHKSVLDEKLRPAAATQPALVPVAPPAASPAPVGPIPAKQTQNAIPATPAATLPSKK